MNKINIVWTNDAKQELKTIQNYYKQKSIQSSKNILNEILKTIKEIRFIEQYQVDEIDTTFRRIIVRQYKIIYTIEAKTIIIVTIFDTRQNPNKLIL
jgi:plasmid stabilization system protein ParE